MRVVMLTKRSTLTILALLLAPFVLVGCGSDKTTSPIRDLATAPENVRYSRGFFIPAYFVLDQQNKIELNQKFDFIIAPRLEDASGINSGSIVIKTGVAGSTSNNESYLDEWSEIDKHEDWFMHSSSTSSPENRISLAPNYPNLFWMDIGSRGWKNFVVSKYKEVVEDNPTIDGVFVDGPPDPSEYIGTLGSAHPTYSASEYEAKAVEILLAIRSAIGSNKIMVSNSNLCKSFTAVADGNMNEGFVHFGGWPNSRQESKAEWLSEVNAIADTDFNGKYLLIGSGSKEETLSSMVEYCYASFLVGYNASSHAYFYWHSNAEGCYGTLFWSDLWEMTIGEPLGDRLESDGTYRRNLTQGVVLANPNDVGEPITVSLDASYLNSVGDTVTSVTLPNKSGAVLKKLD
ncbi:MAG: putative glycoside hydrolase [Candidatus Eisenbacteria bacterium]|nr:putative glycoside hydrolase [Candidatus Eisenbacteria bacterium]